MFSYTVKVFTLKNPKSKLVGFASLLIDDVLQVEGFKIFDGKDGLFVKPPSHEGKNKDGERAWFDDVKFVEDGKMIDFKDKESRAAICRNEIYKSIIEAYNSNATNATNTSRASAAKSQSDVNERNNKRTPLW